MLVTLFGSLKVLAREIAVVVPLPSKFQPLEIDVVEVALWADTDKLPKSNMKIIRKIDKTWLLMIEIMKFIQKCNSHYLLYCFYMVLIGKMIISEINFKKMLGLMQRRHSEYRPCNFCAVKP